MQNSSSKNKKSKEPQKWSTRFKKALDKNMQTFQSSLPFDSKLYRQDIEVSLAHIDTLCMAKIISTDEKMKLRQGLIEIGRQIEANNQKDFFGDEEDDIHMWIEKRLKRNIGSLADKLHTARSRNDQVATDVRLYTRDATDRHRDHLIKLLSSLYEKAQEHVNDIMPGHTHLQPAQPITFSFYLLAYFFMFARDIERFDDCRRRINLNPLGSGAFCGVNYSIDRKISTRKLGFDDYLPNAMDAVADRDYLIEYHHCVATTMTHLSRMAEDLIIFSSGGFDFIEIDDGFTTGSSIMPNKKNPDACELIRGKVGRVFGNLHGLYTILKGQPLAYNRDLQEDKEGLFDTEKTIDDCLLIMSGMIETLKIKKNKMLDALENGYLLATEVADYLVEKGLPFRKAHQITGSIVSELSEQKKGFNEITLEQLKKHHLLFEQDVFNYLDPLNAIKRKKSGGSTSIRSVQGQLIIAKKTIESFLTKKNKKRI